MRFATYNIRHCAPPGRRSNLGATASALASLDAQVVALQEVDRRVVRSCFADQASTLASALGMHETFGSARRLGPFSGYGNALLTARRPERTQVVQLRSSGEQRVAVFGEVSTPLGCITVTCTHLQNRRRNRPDEARGQLNQVLELLSVRPEPWVLMGDLNLRPEAVLPQLGDAGMVAVSSGPTFPADRPRIRIDWVAVRGLEIGVGETPELHASDHRPVVVELGAQVSEREGPGESTSDRSRRKFIDG